MFKGGLAVLIGAASYGVLTTIAKLSYAQGYSSENASVFQIVFGFLMLLCLYVFQKNKIKFNEIKKVEFLKLAFGGATIALTALFYYECVQYISASLGIVLLFQFIWIGFVLDYVFNKIKPSKNQLIGLLVLLLGTFLASGFLSNGKNMEIHSKGIVLGLLSALCYAFYIFINGRLKTNMSAISKSTIMMGVSSVLIILFLPNSFSNNPFFEVEFLKYGIPLALFGAVIPPILFAYGVPKIGVTFSSVLSSVELPVAVIFSITLLNENVSFIQWVGIVLILFSIVFDSFFEKKSS